jgi:ASC-1-like (ASCH) protein
MSTYTKHLSEPWFSLIKLGIKKCEGRLNKGDFFEIKKLDYIIFQNNDFNYLRSFCCKIIYTHIYNSFEDYLKSEKLQKCLPGIDTINEGVNVYYKYYTKEQEYKYKIKAFRLKVLQHSSMDKNIQIKHKQDF